MQHVCTLVMSDFRLKVGSQYDAIPYVTLCRLHIDTRRNARIDSDPILAFLYVASLRLIAKKIAKIFN